MSANPPRRVAYIEWPQENSTGKKAISSGPDCWLYLENHFHGDHDEDWIIERLDDQSEVARHNPRLLQTIVFASEPPPKECGS